LYVIRNGLFHNLIITYGRMIKKLSETDRRLQILKETQNICAKKGFSETTLDMIAKQCKVSRALIVQYFKTKEDLYEALISFICEGHPLQEDINIKEHIKNKDDFGVFHGIALHLCKHMLCNTDQSPVRLIFFSMLERPELYQKHYEQRAKYGLALLRNYIRERIKDGVFKDINPHHVAAGFIAMLIQFIIQEVTIQSAPPNNTKVMPAVETMIHILLDGLKL